MADDGQSGAGLADWLATREHVDAAAREATGNSLLGRLIPHLRRTVPDDAVLEVVDVGAGTGANQRWLAPRLPYRQRWIHLDHDPGVAHQAAVPTETEILIGGIESLPTLLRGPPDAHRIVTCAALLDVLTTVQVQQLCRTITDAGVPAWFSLTVDGSVIIDPDDRADEIVLRAFNAHQSRGGRAGPDAVRVAIASLATAGYEVFTEHTPWQLDGGDPSLVSRFLHDRVVAAVEQQPELVEVAERWLMRRRSEVGAGRLEVLVGHRDVLALPVEDRADV